MSKIRIAKELENWSHHQASIRRWTSSKQFFRHSLLRKFHIVECSASVVVVKIFVVGVTKVVFIEGTTLDLVELVFVAVVVRLKNRKADNIVHNKF